LQKKNNYTDVSVNTSGFGLNEEKLLRWKMAGVNSVTVKLDSFDPKDVKYLTKNEKAFKRAVFTIKKGSKILDEVVVNIVVTRKTLDSLSDTIHFAASLGAKVVRITPVVPCGRARTLKMSLEEIKKIAKIYEELKSITKIKLLCPVRLRTKRHARCLICLAGVTRIFIKENGDVIPCSYLSEKWMLGNIKTTPLKKIWVENELLKKYFRKMWKVDEKCMKCKDREYCFDTCKALAELKFGDILMRDHPERCPNEKK
jgi:radical SAM protein with 4Fe4S-binding SPASM domain